MSYGDNPIASIDLDLLGRNKAVKALKSALLAPNLDTPFTVGVFGAWGSGKASVLNLRRAIASVGPLAVGCLSGAHTRAMCQCCPQARER